MKREKFRQRRRMSASTQRRFLLLRVPAGGGTGRRAFMTREGGTSCALGMVLTPTATRFPAPLGRGVIGPAGVDRWDGVAGAVETAPLAVGVLETGEAASSVGGARAPLLRDGLDVVPPLDVEPRGVVWAMGVGVLGVSAVGVGPLDVRRCWFGRNSGPARIGPGDTEAAPMGAGYAYDRASCIGWFGDAGRGVITKRGNRACICGCMGDGATGDRPLAGVRPMIGVGSWKIAGSISGCRMLRCGLVGG